MWLATIALRVWRRWLARQPSQVILLDEAAEIACLDPEGQPERRTALSFERDAMRSALGRLPPEQREAVVLHYMQDLSYQEVADAQDVPLGTVKSRLHNALKRLRLHLDEAMRK